MIIHDACHSTIEKIIKIIKNIDPNYKLYVGILAPKSVRHWCAYFEQSCQ